MRKRRKYPVPSHIREDVIERDGYKCVFCPVTRRMTRELFGVDLDVHHIDLTGGSDSPNNSPENLVTLCCVCHKKLHLLLSKMLKVFVKIKSSIIK
jgi:5-methylcytosine-specific restriction endonuclease McrA